jgi:5-methylcytosine-specific restriction enzyme subunit McrC
MPEIVLTEWDEKGPETPVLRGRSFRATDTHRLVERLSRLLQIEELRDGLRVRSFAFVGRVEVEDLTITIRPKIEPQTLLGLVQYAFELRHLHTVASAEYQDAGALFQDLLAAQLLSELRELIRSGLFRNYREIRHDLTAPRGRIDFPRLATQTNWNRFSIPCREYPRSTDNILNRVLRAGAGLAASVAQDRALTRDLRAELKFLEEVAGHAELTADLMAQADRGITRQTSAYRPALRLIELLRSACWPSLDGDGSTRLPGFLFDMNRFFQALVSRFLHDHLEGLEVADEQSLAGFMRYLPGHNPRWHKHPMPRPDFTITKGREVVTFLDAKYRDLWEQNLPREMLYQLAIYALSGRSGGNAAIIYPTHAGAGREAVIEIAAPNSVEPPARVSLRPLDLLQVRRVIETGSRGEAVQMARVMVFGERRLPEGRSGEGVEPPRPRFAMEAGRSWGGNS